MSIVLWDDGPVRRFNGGDFVATPGALAALAECGESPGVYIARHLAGDWGDLCDQDKQLNEDAVTSGDRILSAYMTERGHRLYVITEWNRSLTTILLADEY
jgi:hypothetical protein